MNKTYVPTKTVAETFEPNARYLRDLAILHANQGDNATAHNIGKIADKFEDAFETVSVERHYSRVNELLRNNTDQLEENRAQRRIIALQKGAIARALSATSDVPVVNILEPVAELTKETATDKFQELTDELALSIIEAQHPNFDQANTRHEQNILADHLRTWLRDTFGLGIE